MATDTLNPGDRLENGQQLVSGNGRYSLDYQGDGNLVEYHYPDGEVVWATHTHGEPGSADMQGDGNFVIYNARGKALWASGTVGHDGSHLVLQDDANLVIYQGDQPIWTSGVVRPIEPPIVPPFKPAPRFWQGNFCGVRVDGLPPVAGGARDPRLVLSWFYDRYDDDDRAKIRAAWQARNYTHLALSWPDSKSIGRSPEQFLATCEELIAAGFFPCVFFCSKDYDPRDVAAIEARIMEVLPLLIGRIPMACVGWELSLWLTPTQVQELIDWLAPQLTPSGCMVYVHFQQGYMSYQQPGQFVADFWKPNVGKLTGVLHQKVLSQNPEEYRTDSGGLIDALQRMAGNFGMPADSGFGHPFDLVAFEITAAEQFEGTRTEPMGDALGQWAIETPKQHGPAGLVGVMGSGNGSL